MIIENWKKYYETRQLDEGEGTIFDFFRAGLVEPDTALENCPMVAVDFETTGMNPNLNEIVSIGLVPFSLQRIYCKHALHWTVRPAQTVDDASIAFHELTHNELGDSPALKKVLAELLSALQGRLVVVHYRHIEREFLNIAIQKALNRELLFPVIDTMEIEFQIRLKQIPWYRRRLGSRPDQLRLGQCRERYHLPHYRPHHALLDAIATAELLQAQAAYQDLAGKRVGDLWS